MIKFKDKPNTEKQILNILNPVVKKWFSSKFKDFSLPQLHGVMEIHSRNNILVSAPTGATKTLTGFLSILNELIDSAEKGILEDKIYCVYVSPLKALNSDIAVNLIEPLKEMEKIAGKEFGIRVAVRTGDTSVSEKTKMLRKPPHILITTPESLAIVLASIKFSEHLHNVDWCILDEVHALAENKRGVHLSLSMERLQRLSPSMTRVGLSATVAPLEEIAKYLVGYQNKKLRNCKIVDVQFIKELDLKVLSPVSDLVAVEHGKMHHSMYTLIDDLIQKHKTTLIFTNTRAATERVVDHLKEKFPKNYTENIGAHHSSLSKRHRLDIENRLREGKLKVAVCSTSLELGLDIGYIDLVILLSSPKSVARALQRTGRSGHKLHDITKGRIIVLDRDDLVECAVLLKSAVEKKIDKIHIPKNALDVLSQHVHGIALQEQIHFNDLFNLIRQSYCYHDLDKKDFKELVGYLSGKFVSLEDRYIYAKIWHNEETGMIGRSGRMSRVIHMTNIGTIPDETFVTVKIGDQVVGRLDEMFLERLKRNDTFVLGGEKYEFQFSRGTVAQVKSSTARPPTIPSWISEMLPLSFDLSMDIQRFRRYMDDLFTKKKSKEEIMKFIDDYLYVDKKGANAVYEYFHQQFNFSQIPTDKKLVIEIYNDGEFTYYIFHTLFGRRVNDVLSRAVAFAISRLEHRSVDMGISDNGFYIRSDKKILPIRAFNLLKSKDLRKLMNLAIDKSEVLKRRFRHCATRSLMILRNYKGRKKRVGRQQVSSMILMNAVKRINPDFCILKEARREVLEDLMDIENATKILKDIEKGNIKIKEVTTNLPSPFAFNLITMSYMDLMRIEDKVEFIRRMHQNVLAKISLNK